MIYPSYSTNISSFQELKIIFDLLVQLNFKYVPINLGPLYACGEEQRCDTILKDNIVTAEEFIKIYTDFHNKLHDFLNSLEIGSKVIIESRRGPSNNYPFTFNGDMASMAGKEMTIAEIRDKSNDASIHACKFSNGDCRLFKLKEDPLSWSWHSSMFEMTDFKPINHINLSEININSLDFLKF